MKKSQIIIYAIIILSAAAVIVILATGYWERFFTSEEEEFVRTRVINVREDASSGIADFNETMIWADNLETKIPLAPSELAIAILNKESEEGLQEEQFAVYRSGSQIYITFFSYDERTRRYRRMWDEPVLATRTHTITLFSQDIIGDRNNCIIITGMNERNEHTMTVLRKNPNQRADDPYRKIAEIEADGSIIIQEVTRPLAYQQGITSGQSFNIAVNRSDTASANIMDQIETIYAFNVSSGQYEQNRVTRIPGSQIEQRQLRELLSGARGVFENFISDLWYFVTPQGTIDTNQYIYFDPDNREIIFYGDEAQQVFLWQNSSYTRLGLYIRTQNMSINTLLRFIDIELESLDSLRLRVTEDVQLRIVANTTWDGTYRRAGNANTRETISQLHPAIDAVFDSFWGRIQFNTHGEYSISSGGSARSPSAEGRYIFYRIDNYSLLELRSAEPRSNGADDSRMVYTVENVAGVMILSRVRIGLNGIYDLHEPPITLTPVTSDN